MMRGGYGAVAPAGLQNQYHGKKLDGSCRGGFNSHYPSPEGLFDGSEAQMDKQALKLCRVS